MERSDPSNANRREVVALEPFIRAAWCRETAAPSCQETWSRDNPSWGQCAVTALFLHAVFEGELMRTVVDEYGSHYYNRLPDGTVVDLTCDQFPAGTVVPPGEPATLERALMSEGAKAARTPERYALLKDRFLRFAVDALVSRH